MGVFSEDLLIYGGVLVFVVSHQAFLLLKFLAYLWFYGFMVAFSEDLLIYLCIYILLTYI